MMELNKVYCVDCLELMKQMPDNFIDLIITDPPYGINIASNGTIGGDNLGSAKDYGVQEWDTSIPSQEYFEEIKRVSKNQIIFGGNYMTEYLKPSSCWIVWDKDNSGNFADCELAWTSFPTATRLFKWRWNGMLQERMNWKEKREHPTQKPLPLARWIYDKFGKDIKTIFDPFCGSGTFLIPAKERNINFIGCDRVQKYVDIANKRLQQQNLSNFDRKSE